MNLILFDNEIRNRFLPLVYTRPVSELRVGILTISEKWEKALNLKASYITQDYLAEKYPLILRTDNYLINGTVFPNKRLLKLISQMDINQAFLSKEGELIAARLDNVQFDNLLNDNELEDLEGIDLMNTPYSKLNNVWDIFKLNGEQIREDFELLTNGRDSQPISDTNRIVGNQDQIFVEEGAYMECCILNATTGPIYIGKNATVLEGSIIRGGLAVCDNAVIKMGAKIYGPTTIGPFSKVGGEITNSVIWGYSNKSHDGYLGNSILGQWCNLGADTNVSNLKNNYASVKLWDYDEERFVDTGEQFCGLVMGDHSKCGINTMFNTGTVVGVCCNIYGAGYPRNFIPSFSWGGTNGYTTYRTDKVFETIEKVKARRNLTFDMDDRLILLRNFEESAKHRRWEKA